MTLHREPMDEGLLDAAFGSRPSGRTELHPRVVIGNPADRWLRAVADGAGGGYAAAAAGLDSMRGAGRPWRSLALSTYASHLRQAGDHAGARRYDGEALNLVAARQSDAITVAAALDAVTGLAADCLGVGQFDLAARLLDRVDRRLTDHPDGGPWIWSGRPRLRQAWVRTELALYRGDVGSAVSSASAAAALAADAPSVRHRLKTDLIGAAAIASTGGGEEAARVAERCVVTARRHGLLPLEWAATSLRRGVGSADAANAAHLAREESRLRAELIARGGAFTPP